MKLVVELDAQLEGLNEEFFGRYIKAMIDEGAKTLNMKVFVNRVKKPDAKIGNVQYKGKTFFESKEWK